VERGQGSAAGETSQSLSRINIQPRAQAEAEQAAEWYEAQQPGLGIEFVLELDAAIERVAETPLAYAKLYQEARRVLVRRFPFAVYFIHERDVVEVFAVLHQQRAESWWQSRVRR
jgi:plasmid stabilization system protein ParE